MRRNAPATLTEILGSRGPVGARELIASLGVSQPTLSRGIHALGERVRRIGRGRATKYALARTVSTFGSEWQAYRIGESGRARVVGRLHAIAPTGWWYETVRPAPALVPTGDAGVFADLPWFLDDLRPQGFMGRAFARRHGRELGLPEDPRLWSADAVLVTLLLHGEDLPGDWVIGEGSVAKAQQLRLDPPEAIPARERLAHYAALAEEALAGDQVGSSAAGERPKFTTRVRDRDGTVRDVIVKVSPPLATPMGRRWADLLVCECLAADLLAEAGIASSRTDWLEGEHRAYLEVTRFDRTPEGGRLGLISLLALDSELYGLLDTWALAGARLAKDGYLTEAHATHLQVLWWFGRLIENTDMHFGNVSLHLRDELPLSLAPAYDMLPMRHQPTSTGETRRLDQTLELPAPEAIEPWRTAADLAVRYWERVLGDRRVSSSFRREMRARPQGIRRALEHMK